MRAGFISLLVVGSTLLGCHGEPEPLLERIARIEHEQWMEWSKSVADEVSPERRERWERYWIPYDELPEDIKELDRQWARRVLAEVERER